MFATPAELAFVTCLISRPFANLRTVTVLLARPTSVSIYFSSQVRSQRRLCTIMAGTLQKEILPAFSVSSHSICNATATYSVTPINIDQAQQWAAGKRIDILYFPPIVDWLPPRPLERYSNCNTRNKLQDAEFSPRSSVR